MATSCYSRAHDRADWRSMGQSLYRAGHLWINEDLVCCLRLSTMKSRSAILGNTMQAFPIALRNDIRGCICFDIDSWRGAVRKVNIRKCYELGRSFGLKCTSRHNSVLLTISVEIIRLEQPVSESNNKADVCEYIPMRNCWFKWRPLPKRLNLELFWSYYM